MLEYLSGSWARAWMALWMCLEQKGMLQNLDVCAADIAGLLQSNTMSDYNLITFKSVLELLWICLAMSRKLWRRAGVSVATPTPSHFAPGATLSCLIRLEYQCELRLTVCPLLAALVPALMQS